MFEVIEDFVTQMDINMKKQMLEKMALDNQNLLLLYEIVLLRKKEAKALKKAADKISKEKK